MEDTTISIIGIVIAAIIMFLVPTMLIADRSDDISQLAVQTATAEFVNEVIKTGKITDAQYQNFVNRLADTGNTYEIDIEIKILDENTAKKVTDADYTKIGNNTTYSIFTSQIENIIGTDERLLLKQGDVISITVKNNSKTLSQSLKSFYYNISGSEIPIITGTASGTVTINGTT